jgi:tryptophan-rich sensory protein
VTRTDAPLWQPAGVAILGAVAVGAAGGALTQLGDWYLRLRTPAWKPPDWAFGPIWTTILALAAASAVIAWRAEDTRQGHLRVVLLFVANGLFNILWSLFFFHLHRPDLALMEVSFLWLSILAPIIYLYRRAPLAAALMLPYLLWVSAAAVLNYQVIQLNGPFG